MPPAKSPIYDVIVIGSGAGGGVVASRLSEDLDRTVLLVEAGPDYPTIDEMPEDLRYGLSTGPRLAVSERHVWPYVARATATAPPMPIPRGRVTGGSSAINGQIFLRGLPEDFDGWAECGNALWSYDEVLPYMLRVENDCDFMGPFHSQDGPIAAHRFPEASWAAPHRAFVAACVNSGFPACPDANDPASTGAGPYAFNNPGGIRISTAIGYIAVARPRPNFTLWPDTTARRVIFEGTRAVGVELQKRGAIEIVEASEIVLAGGAIESPHLLLLSGIGPADELESLGIEVVLDLPGVGKNLQDHPIVELVWQLEDAHALDVTAPRVQVALRYTSHGSPDRNDMVITPLCHADRIMMCAGINLPAGTGELRLRSSDPAEHPLLDYNFLAEERDRQRMREVIRISLDLASDPAFDGMLKTRIAPPDEVLESEAAINEWIQRAVTSSQHVSCTTKMGPTSDPQAVVDQHGRVHGVSNLTVADASIMPAVIRANTNLTTMVIGERIADFLGSPATLMSHAASAPPG